MGAGLRVPLEQVLGHDVFGRLHPNWREDQGRAVEHVLAKQEGRVWVADMGAGVVVGFVSIGIFDADRSMGEITMLAVDPDYQGGGIGTALTEFALDRLKGSGMKVAVVESVLVFSFLKRMEATPEAGEGSLADK